MKRITRRSSAGVVLLAVLTIIIALSVLGATISVMAIADVKMTAHFKRAVEALYEADAAVQYVKTRIEHDLAAGSLVLDSAVENVDYPAPEGMFFDPVTRLVQTGDTNAYYFVVTGYSDKSRVTVQTVFRRASIFELGLFGDSQLDTKAYGNIFTYDSRIVSDPQPEDSLGGGQIASNGDFFSHQDTFIDGSVKLGEDTMGNDGAWRETPEGGTLITGEEAVPSDRIDPDPLGAIGGDLAADFAHYSVPANNNDGTAVPAINGPKYDVRLKTGEVLTLTSGNYYITDLIIGNGATLAIDASGGPVNIYLTGQLEAKEGSTINVNGDPPDLNIFSNSDDSIILKNGGDFKGLVYAPYAPIQILNSADFYGVAWGESVEVKNGGDVYIDVALMNAYMSKVIKLLSWKEQREG